MKSLYRYFIFTLIVLLMIAILVINLKTTLPTISTVKMEEDPIEKIMSVLLRYGMSSDEKELLLETMRTFHDRVTAASLPYFVYSGTLVGSFRHMDILQWDDDIDVMVSTALKDRLREALLGNRGGRGGREGYDCDASSSRWKFWKRSGSTKLAQWNWPYIDISFYSENETHIWDQSDEDDQGERNYVFKKSDTFPLTLRPLSKLMVWAPHDSLRHLRDTYDPFLSSCWSPTYSHRLEALRNDIVQFPCDQLKSRVPFIHRRHHEDGGCLEMLQLDEGPILTQFLSLHHRDCNNIDPYSLDII